jgi:hypothetical protein
VICRREGTFASYSAACRMRRGVTASSHLTSASVSGPAAPPAFPYARPCTGCFPRRELADCAQHRLIQREPGRCLIAVAAEVRLKPGQNGIASTGKPLTAFPLCSPPESQLVSHASLRGSDRSGFGNSPSTRDTCSSSLDATTSSIATARCKLDATSCTGDPAYLDQNRRPWSSSLDASHNRDRFQLGRRRKGMDLEYRSPDRARSALADRRPFTSTFWTVAKHAWAQRPRIPGGIRVSSGRVGRYLLGGHG